MSFKLFIHKNPVEIKFTKFPAGETHVSFDTSPLYPNEDLNVGITFLFTSNSEIFDLALLVDALRRNFYQKLNISLNLPYLPYGRQDRMCNTGEAFSLKVFGNLINSLGFDHVFTEDAHSDVAGAVIDRLVNIKQNICGSGAVYYNNPANTILVSPDAGANKKVFDFAKDHDYHTVVRADKVRNIFTGKIEETVVYSEHVGNMNFLIVDDICDGGATFLGLAKELRKLTSGNINLYVTHAIFSKGVDAFDGNIDNIYFKNNLSKYADDTAMTCSSAYTVFQQV